MKKVTLGKTGVDVSPLCLGTMLMGTKTDEDTSREILDRFIEQGGNFLDTANCYAAWQPGASGGESEKLLGRYFKDRGNRDTLFIATKVGFGYDGDDLGGADRTLDADTIVRECDKSLQRMGIDTIDLYYAHNDVRDCPLDETLEAFGKLVDAGKVRFIGCSNYKAWRLSEALAVSAARQLPPYVCIQQKHTYARPHPGFDGELWPPVNDDLLDACSHFGIPIVAYSPLMKGAYTRDDKSIPKGFDWPDTDARIEVLRRVAADHHDASPNQIVLAWMMQSRPIVIPLFSVSSMQQLEENLGSLDITLSDEQMTALDEAGIRSG